MDEFRADILKEIANIGGGHAASALSVMLDKRIEQSIPNVRLVPLPEVPVLLGGAENVVVAGLLRIKGDFSGYLMMVFSCEQARKMISLMLGKPSRKRSPANVHKFSSMDRSVLSETVNILGGSYLTAISDFTQLRTNQSIPYLSVDMVGAIINVVVAEVGKTGDFALMFQSELCNEQERIAGDLFLIPDEKSCQTIFGSLGIL
ncbi:CheY-P phosphatase CheC [bioreactor metagenome]|uniref:CheY-P phosphatase CheC n=1 Tax=bioreactor metagenome TaxID=1076179 RepID=A0A644ZS91_9ZZZZ